MWASMVEGCVCCTVIHKPLLDPSRHCSIHLQKSILHGIHGTFSSCYRVLHVWLLFVKALGLLWELSQSTWLVKKRWVLLTAARVCHQQRSGQTEQVVFIRGDINTSASSYGEETEPEVVWLSYSRPTWLPDCDSCFTLALCLEFTTAIVSFF